MLLSFFRDHLVDRLLRGLHAGLLGEDLTALLDDVAPASGATEADGVACPLLMV